MNARCVIMLYFGMAAAVIPPQNPPWSPTYNMLESLISMQCNSSGFSSPERGSEFGIISYDWSNAKTLWSKSKPMTCEELLVEQVEATTKNGGTQHFFVYRNIVKALPWFNTVREKLDDPNYEGFFLKFDPNQRPFHIVRWRIQTIAVSFHDQEQTPEVPTPSNEHPDGSCVDYCDCGKHPCGEYLFDHRNGTMLRKWILEEVIMGPTAVGHDLIDGLFLDDYWCSSLICNETQNKTAGCPCDDPVQGPTEIDKYAQFDMGLSDEDIRQITLEWNKTMGEVQRVLLENEAYTWSLIPGQENANAAPFLLSSNASNCTASLREACDPDSLWQHFPVLFGFSVNGTVLTQLQQDLAFFLLARGPYAFAGWGTWGMIWPFSPEPRHGQLPPMPEGVPLPEEFHYDYGVPKENCCSETSPGVFSRKWSRVSVELDCNIFRSKIEFIDSALKMSRTKQDFLTT